MQMHFLVQRGMTSVYLFSQLSTVCQINSIKNYFVSRDVSWMVGREYYKVNALKELRLKSTKQRELGPLR